MDEVWRFRRVFGGALRQVGVVAAAGIVALETMIDRLDTDHDNARRLAEGLADTAPDGAIDVERVQTNMVVLDATVCGTDAEGMINALRDEGVLSGPMSATTVRFVTHKDVDARGIDRAIAAFAKVVKSR